MKPIAYFKGSNAFYDELAEYVKGKSVLEIYSGNGLLAHKLLERGVTVRPTSLFSGHDGHEFGFHADVERMEARIAIQAYEHESDVLLVSWPVADKSIIRAISLWPREKPIVYIGEMPNSDLSGLAGLPGCACDEFFEVTEVIHEFKNYSSQNLLEKAVILKLKD